MLQRVRAEFLEMPGLRLTRAQARRLWALDELLCDAILTALVDARFLVHSGNVVGGILTDFPRAPAGTFAPSIRSSGRRRVIP